MLKIGIFSLLLTVGAFAAAGTVDVTVAVRTGAPGTVFVENEEPVFELAPEARGAFFSVKDWRGRELLKGKVPEGGKLRLPKCSPGYYAISLEAKDADFEGVRTFAVVVDPGKRRRDPGSFIALDTAMSWLAAPRNPRIPRNSFDVVAELVRLAGVDNVRDRLGWKDIEPERGAFRNGPYMANAERLAARGIGVLGMYHDAPGWTKSHSRILPDDLVAVYDFARKAALAFRGKITGWEFWNEQDTGFADGSAWDYAACLKAASLGFRAGAPELPVLIGGIAVTPLTPYNDVVMKNGAAGYFDIFNVHTYRPLRDYPAIIADIRGFMNRYAIGDKPLYFTECGTLAEGTGRVPSFLAGVMAHSPEQEMLVAEFLPKSAITMHSLGVDRNYFFVLPPYSEHNGSKDWGLMRRDFSVKPGYAALAALTAELGTARYLGRVELGDRARGYLFARPDGARTLAFWTLSELDTEPFLPGLTPENPFRETVTLALPDGEYRLTELTGGTRRVFATGGKLALAAERYPAYLSDVRSLEPDETRRPRSEAAKAVPAADETIVFKSVLSEDFALSSSRSRVDIRRIPGRLTLEIFNLSNREKAGSFTVAGGRAEGVPESVTVPPFGKAEIPLVFTPEWNAGECELKVTGIFDGRPVSELLIPVMSAERMLRTSRSVPLGGGADPGAWRPNAAGKMEISFDRGEKAVTFRTVFPEGVDCWSYPEYVLQLPQESLRGARAVAFEMKTDRPEAVKASYLMAVYGTAKERGESILLPVPLPEKEWRERLIPLEGVDADRVGMLRIGVNAAPGAIRCLIRNIRIVYTD